jgi:hypothetical protein
MPPTKKKLALAGGKFTRDGADEPDPVTTGEQFRERAIACLEEAARSQHPVNDSFTAQAQVWLDMANTVK